MKRSTLVVLAAGASLLPLSGAGAQTAAASQPGVVAEVVVTAEKRETKLETTPATISVVSGQAIEQQNVLEVSDLKSQIPSLTINESPGGLPGVSLRGIGSSASNQLVEQSVGLFVDGVYHPRAREFTDALFDVAQMEVVKGSQGVLFGKNTDVGAISITSNRPGDGFGGYLSAGYEAEFGSWNTEGAVNLPISSNLRVRLAGMYSDEAGYVEDFTQNRESPDEKRWLLRAMIDWDPSSAINVLLKLQGSHETTIGNGFQYLESPTPAALADYGVSSLSQLGVLSTANYTQYTGGLGNEGDAQESFDPELTVKVALGGGYTLTSITGFSDYSYHYGFDSDTTPLPIIFNYFHEHFSQESEELRVASPVGHTFEWIAGVFALHHNDLFDYDLTFQNFGLAPGLGLSGVADQEFTQTDDSYSGFGQGSWHVTNRLTIEVGARLSSEVKHGDYVKTVPTAFTPNIVHPATLAGRISDTTLDASGTASYKLSDSGVFYVSVGKGSKAGAFNNTSLLTAPTPSPFIVPDEVAITYEAGLKGRFLDGRGYASLDGFIIDVSNFQDSSYSAAAHGFLIRSIGAHTRGVEGEAQFQATHWLQFYGNFAYTPTARLADGERMQRAPVFTDVVGARLSTPLTKDWDFAANVELNHSSSFYNQPPLAPGDNLSGGYSIVDARIAVIDRPAHLELSISASNLNDAVYREFTFGAPLGGTVGILNRPRTITFTVKKGF